MILKTELGYWFFHKILALHIMFTFVSFGVTNGFEDLNFAATQSILLALSSILLWFSYADKESAVINKQKEWIEIKDALNRIVLNASLKDITDMEWENKNIIYNTTRYGKRGTNKKSFAVTFKSGYEWYAEGADYKNFFEIQGYLLTYCAKNQIIKVRPLEERKRSRRKANPFKKRH